MNPEQEDRKEIEIETDGPVTTACPEPSTEVESEASVMQECSDTQPPMATDEECASHPNPLQSELDQAKEQVEEHYRRYLRTQADFDNFRRRVKKDKEDLAKYASEKVVKELLSVVDNFERALTVGHESTETDSFVKGVTMIFRQIQQVIEQEGVQPMNAVGEPFNPEYHQAIMEVESDQYEEGVVVEEVQRGYMLKDKVLRPAIVKVSGQ